MSSLATIFLSLVMLFSSADGQTNGDDNEKRFQPKVKPALAVHRADNPIKIDGKLDDPAWTGITMADGWTEIQPGNQVQPRVRTEAMVSYDESNLYVAFHAYDDPKSLRATLRNRDEAFDDDWVGFLLDTYGDGTQTYEIFVNPLGVQMDLMRSATGNEDSGFDMVFHAESEITSDGYVVEIAIPFSSLRFRDEDAQSWNVTFIRNHPRDVRRLYSWATMDMGNSCIPCQFGSISGISGVHPGDKLKLIPSVVGHQAGQLRNGDDPGVGFDNGPFRPEFSLSARYDFTPSLAAEATVNPDFSQVESDAQQIDVNSTFALFYAERRPFFQEGSDLFRTPFDLVYTRSINNPISAVKMTGKVGRTSLAVLSAVDEDTPILMPFAERSELVRAGRSVSNVMRAMYSLGSDGHVGATVTDRRILDGGSGSIVSLDTRIPFWKRYNATAQYAISNTVEPNDPSMSADIEQGTFDDGRYTNTLDGEQFMGQGFYTNLNRSDRHWNFDVSYRASSPTFRTANGFVTGNARHTLNMFQGYNIYPAKSFVTRFMPGLEVSDRYRWTGARQATSINPFFVAEVKGQSFINGGINFNTERFRGHRFDGLYNVYMSITTRPVQQFSGGFYLNRGRQIARNEDVPVKGRSFEGGFFMNLKPIHRLVISPELNYAEMRHLESDDQYFSGYILRVHTGLQFSRELSTRLITQYNQFDKRWSLEPLVAYQLNPFSVFYVGSTHSMGDYGRPHGLVETQRQLFFKFQYLIQR